MSVFLAYLKTNVRNLVGLVFIVLAVFFGTRFDPLKEPTINLVTELVNVLVPAESEVKAVEIAPSEVVIVPNQEIIE